MKFDLFQDLAEDISSKMREAPLIHPPRWQSIDVSQNPNAATYELLN